MSGFTPEPMTFKRRLKYLLYNFVPGLAGRFPYYGSTVHFPAGAPVFREICERGAFEPDIVDRLCRLARPASTVFDVGANIGLMAIPVLRGCDTCRVVSFEPSPNSLPFLRETVRGSTFADRWIVRDVALAASPGELDFTIGRPADALFEGFNSTSTIANARVITVKVSTLDAEWRALDRPSVSVIKIDVEGAEGGVLEGASEVLGTERPAVLLEWEAAYLSRFGTAAESLLAIANQFGYQLFTIPAGVPVNDSAALRVQMLSCQNYLLMPKEPQ
jgi:FkbM family methyltransferase